MSFVVNATPPPLYPRARKPVSTVQEDGWASGPEWEGEETLSTPRFDPRTVQSIASRYTDCAEGLRRTTKPTIKISRSQHDTCPITKQRCYPLTCEIGCKIQRSEREEERKKERGGGIIYRAVIWSDNYRLSYPIVSFIPLNRPQTRSGITAGCEKR